MSIALKQAMRTFFIEVTPLNQTGCLNLKKVVLPQFS